MVATSLITATWLSTSSSLVAEQLKSSRTGTRRRENCSSARSLTTARCRLHANAAIESRRGATRVASSAETVLCRGVALRGGQSSPIESTLSRSSRSSSAISTSAAAKRCAGVSESEARHATPGGQRSFASPRRARGARARRPAASMTSFTPGSPWSRDRLGGDLAESPTASSSIAKKEPRTLLVELLAREHGVLERHALSVDRRTSTIITLWILLPWSPQPGWRNWQTRRPQKPLLERVCGFESHSGHC